MKSRRHGPRLVLTVSVPCMETFEISCRVRADTVPCVLTFTLYSLFYEICSILNETHGTFAKTFFLFLLLTLHVNHKNTGVFLFLKRHIQELLSKDISGSSISLSSLSSHLDSLSLCSVKDVLDSGVGMAYSSKDKATINTVGDVLILAEERCEVLDENIRYYVLKKEIQFTQMSKRPIFCSRKFKDKTRIETGSKGTPAQTGAIINWHFSILKISFKFNQTMTQF